MADICEGGNETPGSLKATKLIQSVPNLIPPYKAAYQQGLSTTHQLLRLVEQTTIGFNNRATTVAIFLDVKSAFDSVWHTGIIYKLIQSEVPDALIHTIADFLRNRLFCVKEDCCLSRQKKIQGGVPQGSVLGPYLYCAYTSDLPETDVTRLALCADDTLAHTTHRNADLAIGRLQRHVHLIEEWFQHWHLLVNTMKSQVIAFSRTRSVPQTKLTLYGTALEFQDSVKYLGTHLDSRLLWHTNIANTRAKTIARMPATTFVADLTVPLCWKREFVDIEVRRLVTCKDTSPQVPSYGAKSDAFLDQIVTGDETWVRYVNAETKLQSMQWGHTHSPKKPTKCRQTLSTTKLMATVFWDTKGILLVEFLERNATINAERYCNTPTNLKRAIQNKRRDMLNPGAIFLHDNARPHTARRTATKLQEFNWKVLDHPPYSPDLVPSDYHLFMHMKT
ncbi:hypothetical protein ANN_13557 [Periplaneta americana]|uniref:Reverse transcriptase domain-containing protein n=1 Tax=Periplaneta americana TaxID=6978 RepID=A0ABQ8TLH3_PERAM|nr:hypothetical protein ANN_13557 [Periplaneta americana]